LNRRIGLSLLIQRLKLKRQDMIDQIILCVLSIMIFYDFSLHLIETLGWDKFFYPRRNMLSYYWFLELLDLFPLNFSGHQSSVVLG